MKKIILSIIPVLFLLSVPSKTYAYWHFAGMSIPTSFSEVKQIFTPKKQENTVVNQQANENTNDTQKTITTTTQTVTKTTTATENHISKETSRITGNPWSLAISQAELNRYISSYLIGDSFAGYTVNKGSAVTENGNGIMVGS